MPAVHLITNTTAISCTKRGHSTMYKICSKIFSHPLYKHPKLTPLSMNAYSSNKTTILLKTNPERYLDQFWKKTDTKMSRKWFQVQPITFGFVLLCPGFHHLSGREHLRMKFQTLIGGHIFCSEWCRYVCPEMVAYYNWNLLSQKFYNWNYTNFVNRAMIPEAKR